MKNKYFDKQKQNLVEYWKKEGIVKDKKIIDAFMKVPREEFVPKNLREYAYDDAPLPIGYNSTISQPTTIVMMLEWLELENKEDFKILEIGTGSGYNPVLIGEICNKGKVFSLEIIPELIFRARDVIKKLGIKNVKIVEDNGALGYNIEKMFDRIIVTAACNDIPKELIKQLKEDGIILAPVNSKHGDYQNMIKGVKKHGVLITKELGEFRFVPLKEK